MDNPNYKYDQFQEVYKFIKDCLMGKQVQENNKVQNQQVGQISLKQNESAEPSTQAQPETQAQSLNDKINKGIDMYQVLAAMALQKKDINQCMMNFHTALLLAEQFYGKFHLKVIEIKFNIALINYKQNLTEKSITSCLQILEELDKMSNQDKAAYQLAQYRALRILADSYSKIKQFEKASQVYLKVLEKVAMNQQKGVESIQYAQCLYSLAFCLGFLNKGQETFERLNKAIQIFQNSKQKAGFEIQDLLNCYQSLSRLNYDKKDFPKAVQIGQKALQISTAFHQGIHSDQIPILAKIGGILIDSKQYQKAEPFLTKSLLLNQVFNSQDMYTAKSFSYMAKVLHQRQQYQKAVSLLGLAMQILNKLGQFESHALSNVYLLMGEAFEKLENPQIAQQFGLMAKIMYLQKLQPGNELLQRASELAQRCHNKKTEQKQAAEVSMVSAQVQKVTFTD